jgi:hypothetical protein
MNRYGIFITLSTLLFFSGVTVVLAEGEDTTSASVMPANLSIVLQPGSVWRSTLNIKNDSKSKTEFFVYTTVFTGVSRLVPVIPKEVLPSGKENLDIIGKDWLTLEKKSIELNPAEIRQLSFSLVVPDDASPGNYNLGFLIGKNPNLAPEDNTSVSVGKFVASVIALRVTDTLVERLNLREFSTRQRVYTTPSIPIHIALENLKSKPVTPTRAVLKIQPVFATGLPHADIVKELTLLAIAPNSTKTGDFIWSPISPGPLYPLGLYQASVIVSYGTNGQQHLTDTLNILIIPRSLLIIVLATLLLIVFFIHRFKK